MLQGYKIGKLDGLLSGGWVLPSCSTDLQWIFLLANLQWCMSLHLHSSSHTSSMLAHRLTRTLKLTCQLPVFHQYAALSILQQAPCSRPCPGSQHCYRALCRLLSQPLDKRPALHSFTLVKSSCCLTAKTSDQDERMQGWLLAV